jgi:sugar O-acyltransferase (sialic acid O-acetyltransferase NeuD family)
MVEEGKIIIVGAGEFAEIAYEYFTHDSPYNVVAFSVEKSFITTNEFLGLPLVPFEELEQLYDPNDFQVFVAVTYNQLNKVRKRLYKEAKLKGFHLVSYVSSQAFVWHNVKIGENCFIFENNVLQYHAEIGNNVIIWSANYVGHRVKIRDHCFITAHVVVSAYSEVGENCFFGVNSSILDNLTIGNDCIIGAGALVLKNTAEGMVYIGNPAKAVKSSSKVEKL